MDTGRDANGVRSLSCDTLEQIVAASPAAVLVLDARDARLSVVYASPAYERLTGAVNAEIAGRPWALLERGSAADSEVVRLKGVLERREAACVRIKDQRVDGTPLVCEVAVTPLRGEDGGVSFLLCAQRTVVATESVADATSTVRQSIETTGQVAQLQPESVRARQKTVAHDRIDSATGLLKFSYFHETVRRDLALARREQRTVTLLAFEIVEFDAYRRTFGDKAADSCQRMIGAQIVRTLRRAADLCARYDDTTIVAAVVGQEPNEIRPLAEQIADNVQQLKLHNPRAKTNRYISVRVAVHGCQPGVHDEVEPIIVRMLEEARAREQQPLAAHA